MSDYLAAAKSNIETMRKKPLTVVVMRDGQPVPHGDVTIQQKKHEFLFGANCFLAEQYETPAMNQQYDALFTEVFNYATLPYYWGAYEPERGVPRPEKVSRLLDWCDRFGLDRKGHPLHWHEVPPAWLTQADGENMEALCKRRVGDVVRLFKDRVKRWDIVNEITRASKFTGVDSKFNIISRYEVQRGAVHVVDMLARLAMEIDPEAQLLLNECNLASDDFPNLITALLARGTPLAALGLQCHMHGGTCSHEHLWHQTEKYAAFGLPLHYTEFSILSGRVEGEVDWYSNEKNHWITSPEAEQRQAQETEELYTLLFGHPAVEAITWWDIVDGYWLNAPSGLLSHDMQAKPAYHALRKLVKGAWWTKASGTTDGSGTFTADAFYGRYTIRATVDGAASEVEYTHAKKQKEASTVTLSL